MRFLGTCSRLNKANIHLMVYVSDNKAETLKIGLDDWEKGNLVCGCERKLPAKQTWRLWIWIITTSTHRNIINWKNIETACLNSSMSTSQKAADV